MATQSDKVVGMGEDVETKVEVEVKTTEVGAPCLVSPTHTQCALVGRVSGLLCQTC
jgi:hypothetical protein